jgi:hypothetical protein
VVVELAGRSIDNRAIVGALQPFAERDQLRASRDDVIAARVGHCKP